MVGGESAGFDAGLRFQGRSLVVVCCEAAGFHFALIFMMVLLEGGLSIAFVPVACLQLDRRTEIGKFAASVEIFTGRG